MIKKYLKNVFITFLSMILIDFVLKTMVTTLVKKKIYSKDCVLINYFSEKQMPFEEGS